MNLSLETQVECAVCQKPIGTAEYRESVGAVAISGAAPYASCPACAQETNPNDTAYVRRARRWTAFRNYIDEDQ